MRKDTSRGSDGGAGQTETESERESKCHWHVDRWASGHLRQVDSATHHHLHQHAHHSVPVGDVGWPEGVRRLSPLNKRKRKPPNSLSSRDHHLNPSAERQRARWLTRRDRRDHQTKVNATYVRGTQKRKREDDRMNK